MVTGSGTQPDKASRGRKGQFPRSTRLLGLSLATVLNRRQYQEPLWTSMNIKASNYSRVTTSRCLTAKPSKALTRRRPRRIGYPVVVKAQVQVGGRGKAGGIKLASNADECRQYADDILGLDIKGHVVALLWIETASDISEEYYASFTLDRSAKKHLGMLSAAGE